MLTLNLLLIMLTSISFDLLHFLLCNTCFGMSLLFEWYASYLLPPSAHYQFLVNMKIFYGGIHLGGDWKFQINSIYLNQHH